MGESWTVKRVLDWAAGDFASRGMETPRLEAELLLCAVLDLPRIRLYTDFDRPLNRDELDAARGVISRRRGGEPSAYITGKKEFWSLELEVGPGVLVPRPDTEVLVEAAVARFEDGPVLDLCTGSGCVALAIARELDGAAITATDISPLACETARRNALRLALQDRVEILEGDLYGALPAGVRFDVIVSNPPYVISAEIDSLQEEVRREPRLALDGGPDGLSVIGRILSGARDRLLPGGRLLLELDPRQASRVATELGPALLGAVGEILNDLAGRARVVTWRI
jgi:release factor glutamine methyltransferase